MLGRPLWNRTMARVVLDKGALFALASDTRVEILQALRPMRRTVTQLAEELQIDKAAIHRHLQKLVDGGLVQRFEDHGFVYYGLAWKTRDILDPSENTRIVIRLSSAIAMAVIASVVLFVGFTAVGPVALSEPFPDGFGLPVEDGADVTNGDGRGPGGTSLPPLAWFIPAVVLLALAVPLLLSVWQAHRRPFQPRA